MFRRGMNLVNKWYQPKPLIACIAAGSIVGSYYNISTKNNFNNNYKKPIKPIENIDIKPLFMATKIEDTMLIKCYTDMNYDTTIINDSVTGAFFGGVGGIWFWLLSPVIIPSATIAYCLKYQQKS